MKDGIFGKEKKRKLTGRGLHILSAFIRRAEETERSSCHTSFVSTKYREQVLILHQLEMALKCESQSASSRALWLSVATFDTSGDAAGPPTAYMAKATAESMKRLSCRVTD